jgi:hypothetical protein
LTPSNRPPDQQTHAIFVSSTTSVPMSVPPLAAGAVATVALLWRPWRVAARGGLAPAAAAYGSTEDN